MLTAVSHQALLRSAVVVAAVGVACGLLFPGSGVTALDPPVQIVGCSDSSRIFAAYDFASSRHAAVNSAVSGQSLDEWAEPSSIAWRGGSTGTGRLLPGFDANFARFGASAVWYPLCIQVDDYTSDVAAYRGFKRFINLLRQRTDAPLYLSPTIGAQPSCAKDDQPEQDYVVTRAVSEGLALRGPDVPPADVPMPDGCHFDPFLSTNVQKVAVGFIDG